MQLYIFELRRHRRGTIIWSLSMIAMMVMSLAKYQTITAGGPAIQQMMNQFPATVQAVFGMNGLDLGTLAGYVGVCFLFIAVLLAVHAGLLGAELLAEEEQDKTTEFLYVRPRSRTQIVTAKLLAGLVCLMAVWLATAAGTWLAITQFASMNGFWQLFWLFMGAAALVQLVFYCLGLAAASIATRPNLPAKFIAGVVFGSYLLYVLAKLSPSLSWLHYLSVFSYFDAGDIIHTLSLNLQYCTFVSIISVAAILATYICYIRRDLQT
jgi:ABC-2 type transport system permease protein